MTDIPPSLLEAKIEELRHVAVRTTVTKALLAMAAWAFMQGREHGLREAKEKEETK